MKILTWNVNGIRAVKPSTKELFVKLDADIICLQETKVTRDQLDEPTAILEGYNSYFSFSRARSGYSGVATFVKDSCTPVKAEEGLTGLLTADLHDNIGHYGNQSEFSDEELHSLDNEGRAIITQHNIKDSEGNKQLLTVINVYCPRADPEKEERKTFKISFYRLLQTRAEALLKAGSRVIILGDINTSHTKLDHCDPTTDTEFYTHPGRRWLNQFLNKPDEAAPESTPPTDLDSSFGSDTGRKFVDTFRKFHPTRQNAYTCWHTLTSARATNYGVRIDYILGDVDLVDEGFVDCNIMPEIEGSDHCPVRAVLSWEIVPAAKCPPSCSKYMPEFAGKQQKLSSFFVKKAPKLSQESERSDPVEDKSSTSSGPTSSQESTSSGSISQDLQEGNAKTTQDPAGSVTVKRLGSPSLPAKPAAKRLKKDEKMPSGGKQGSLLSFFSKPAVQQSPKVLKSQPAERAQQIPSSASSEVNVTKTPNNNTGESMSNGISKSQPAVGSSQQKASATSSWKNLLKGPPQPPLCKGHSEPCLLRTVKKDSLNKGRQFWVCPRPEGHKTNPEARCDHFVWVDKKKS